MITKDRKVKKTIIKKHNYIFVILSTCDIKNLKILYSLFIKNSKNEYGQKAKVLS